MAEVIFSVFLTEDILFFISFNDDMWIQSISWSAYKSVNNRRGLLLDDREYLRVSLAL